MDPLVTLMTTTALLEALAEGALIGAGASIIGIGSDVLGSIRLPALFNGIFGHKPTPKITPLKGHWPMGQDEQYFEYLVIGPLVRYAIDLKLMMKVMCGNKLSAELRLEEPVDLKSLNIFFMEDVGFDITVPNVSEDIKRIIRASVTHLTTDCGATVIPNYKFEDFKKALVICVSSVFALKDIPDVRKWEQTNIFLELIKSIFRKSRYTLQLLYVYVMEWLFKTIVSDYTTERKQLKNLIVEKLGKNGVLILPTFMGSAFKHHQSLLKTGFTYLAPSNALGLPATSIPCGFDKNGMPIGLQVMASPNQDRLCIAIAEELERFFGGWIPPPEKDC